MLYTILLQAQQAVNDLNGGTAILSGNKTEMSLSVFDLALKGGWIMIPIAISSVIAVYIFVERYMVISRASVNDKNLMNNIREFIHAGKIDSALALCRNNETPIARMIEKGLSRLGRPLNDINTAIENVGNLEVSKLEKGVTALATIAGAAPMLGFLGTVTGMVRAFYNMAAAGNNIDIQLLSSGIYEAMITTVGGLIVGILAYVLYNMLVSRIEKVVFLLEARALEFMDLLHEPVR
jgi:biopolymer transport protein ExbB